jgi:23S rRNA (guanosine2251-2'-O)-methyltransferase
MDAVTTREGDAPGQELIYGIHPVTEALDARRRSIERVLVARDRGRGLGRILRMAREAGIPVSHLPAAVLRRKVGAGATHQGVAAVVSPVEYADARDLCRAAAARPDGLLVLLDRVVDPGNLGAAVRTAAAAGAQGLLLAGEGTAGLTPAVAKASAGALERLPVAREARPARRIAWLRERGVRAVALDPAGETPWDRADLGGPLLVVAGGEERGPRTAVVEACNVSVALPMSSDLDSLNVSVALGVLLYEARRQRGSERSERHG